MKAVVLFEGAGGSTRGLHDAGYTTVGFDHWQPAVTCAQANGYDSHLHDLSDPAGDHLIPYAPLWWASPPCQPFSAAGAGDGEFDGRDGFPWLLRLVALRLPDVLIVENVKGLTFRKHSAYLCGILEALRALGYHVEWKVLMAADYGVPQTRERCIIVARRDGGRITWPAPTHCETGGMFTARWVSMADALGWNADLPIMARHQRGAGMIDRHGERPDRPITEPAMTIRQGGGGDPGGFVLRWSTEGGMNQDLRRSVDQPSPTVTGADARNFALTDESIIIPLTTHELATLQGFPADWTWTGTKTQQARMIGNAVPPRLAEVVAANNRPATR